VLGVMLLTMDRYRRDASDALAQPVMRTSDSLVGGHV
jgi:hypothetical protein